MTQFEYTVIFEPAEEGGWLAHVPALNGLTTEGETLEEARYMAKDAIKGYIETLQKNHLPIPEDIVEAKLSTLDLEKLAIAL